MRNNGAPSILADLERRYASNSNLEFERIIEDVNTSDDNIVADVIECDGRLRLSRRMDVRLDRYLRVLPDLPARPVPLDAAIDVALRSMSRGARVDPRAVEDLVGQYPQMEAAIREAAALNAALWSTTGLRRLVEPLPLKPLPSDFGPLLPDGRRRYELQQLLGQGAFGQVYLGFDRQLSEEGHAAKVAIKILVLAGEAPWSRARLIEEATKVRRINHANVVLVHDRGVTEQDEDFIVYEYVEAGDLARRLEARPAPWPASDAARMAAKIALGVHAAHSAGVIHCDLKPGNIMLNAADEPKVADFGIAIRLGAAQELRNADAPGLAGNIAFISPEQYRGEEGALSVQSDIYALGGILFLLLTGELPNGSTVREIAQTHDGERGRVDPPRLRGLGHGVDHDLEAICRRALAPRPQDRYASAAAMAEDLEHWLAHEPIGWTRPGFSRVLRLWARRKPGLAAAAALGFLMIGTSAIVGQRLSAIANQKRVEAAVTQSKLVQQGEAQQKEIAGRVELAKHLTSLKQTYRLNLEVLNQIWLLEYVFGPRVLNVEQAQSQLWQNRIKIIRGVVNEARRQGRGNQMETLLWEGALGFWLVSDGDYTEAEPLLTENIAKWSVRLDANDEWLTTLRAMAACAAVNRRVAQAATVKTTTGSDAELLQLQAALDAYSNQLDDGRTGTPVHLLVLRATAALHGPTLLNDPRRRDDAVKWHEALLKISPANPTATRPN